MGQQMFSLLRSGRLTECVAVAHFGSPAPDQMNLILWHARHAGVPRADEVDILLNALGLDIVEDDRVHVLAAGKHLAEAGLDLGVQLAALLGAVDEVG